jgi:L-fucose isomerase-like protein
MNMIRTARWMKDARLLSINGNRVQEAIVPHLATQVRAIPHARFVEEYAKTPAEGPVAELADAYKRGAKAIVEPSDRDILESAKCYFVFKRLQQAEHADAIMMDCLPGLQIPHKHVPPCMGFMSMRDEGVVVGCQADLSATLSMMLVQQLFGKPGFQQNASMDTTNNLYFGSHCTCPTKMNGPGAKREPYVLRSHAEAGWGCVPRVLFPAGQELTIAQYVPAEKPKMHVYTGKVVDCPEIPPAGGCRTNVRMTINEIADVCDVQGMHQTIFYGNHGRQLRMFCQMFGIEVMV